MTQLELARRAKLSVGTIRNAECGSRIKPATASAISSALGVSLFELGVWVGNSQEADRRVGHTPAFLTLLGRRLRRMRTEQGMTPARLAELTGFSESTIRNAEKGNRITFYTARCIAEAMETTLSDLGGGIPDGNDENEHKDLAFRLSKAVREMDKAIHEAIDPGEDGARSGSELFEYLTIHINLFAYACMAIANAQGNKHRATMLLDVSAAAARQIAMNRLGMGNRDAADLSFQNVVKVVCKGKTEYLTHHDVDG